MVHLRQLLKVGSLGLLVSGITVWAAQAPSVAPDSQAGTRGSGAEGTGTDPGAGRGSIPPAPPMGKPPSHPSEAPAKPPPPSEPRVGLPANEQRLIVKLHEINRMEIALGNLAKDRAVLSDVKSYGDKLVNDHSTADSEIKSIAKENSIDLTKTPADVDHASNMKTMSELKTLSGDAFDQRFITFMAEGHEKVVREVTQARQNTSNAKLSALLDNLLPTLKHHRDTAMKLQRGKGAAARRTSQR